MGLITRANVAVLAILIFFWMVILIQYQDRRQEISTATKKMFEQQYGVHSLVHTTNKVLADTQHTLLERQKKIENAKFDANLQLLKEFDKALDVAQLQQDEIAAAAHQKQMVPAKRQEEVEAPKTEPKPQPKEEVVVVPPSPKAKPSASSTAQPSESSTSAPSKSAASTPAPSKSASSTPAPSKSASSTQQPKKEDVPAEKEVEDNADDKALDDKVEELLKLEEAREQNTAKARPRKESPYGEYAYSGPISPYDPPAFSIICERDVGLGSLIYQVLNSVVRSKNLGRMPVTLFKENCVYYVESGWHGADNVWEYYWRPLVDKFPAASIPQAVADDARKYCEVGKKADGKKITYEGKTYMIMTKFNNVDTRGLDIPPHLDQGTIDTMWEDVRREAHKVAQIHLHLQPFMVQKLHNFWDQNGLESQRVLGIHIRGTDALVNRAEKWRKTFRFQNYVEAIAAFRGKYPQGHVLVATDDKRYLSQLHEEFGTTFIHTYATIHADTDDQGRSKADTVGQAIMPSYLLDDRQRAALNGEEGVIEMYLLSKCSFLLHNASAFAAVSTVLNDKLGHLDVMRPDPQTAMRRWTRTVSSRPLMPASMATGLS